MTQKELKQAAIDCLGKAFQGDGVRPDPHIVSAAVTIVLTK